MGDSSGLQGVTSSLIPGWGKCRTTSRPWCVGVAIIGYKREAFMTAQRAVPSYQVSGRQVTENIIYLRIQRRNRCEKKCHGLNFYNSTLMSV